MEEFKGTLEILFMRNPLKGLLVLRRTNKGKVYGSRLF